MKPRDGVFMGIDVGATNVRAAVVDSEGHVLGEEKHRLVSREPPQVAEAVVRAAKTACGAAGMPFSELLGMGVGIAGSVQRGTGLVLDAPQLGWHSVPFLKLLQARAPRLPLWIANELAVAAWGERAAGAGRGVDDLLVVLVGGAVGSALILGGKLHEGASGGSGELGHVVVQPGGRACACGQKGCLEAYVGGQQLAACAREELRAAIGAMRAAAQRAPAAARILYEHVNGDPEKITVAVMERCAHEGDEPSRRILETAGQLLGTAVANLVTVLNPARLLLGGGVLGASPRLLRAAIAAIDARAHKAARAALTISAPALGETAPVVGAALLARASLPEAA